MIIINAIAIKFFLDPFVHISADVSTAADWEMLRDMYPCVSGTLQEFIIFILRFVYDFPVSRGN